MAVKLANKGTATPNLADRVAGIEDPSGTPLVRLYTLTAIRDLLQGNFEALTAATGTITTSTPVLDASQTWNDGAVTFTGLKMNVTDTASASASKLLDLLVGGVSKASIDKTAGLSLYNLNDGAGNEEVGVMRWVSNILQVGTDSAGTGGNRNLNLMVNGVARMKLSATNIVVDRQLRSSGQELGGSSFYWSTTYTDKLLMKDYMETVEAAAPASPAANTVRVFAQDNGSGKTELMALFATGAAQQIAIEP